MTENVQPLSHQQLKEIVRAVRETIKVEMRTYRQHQALMAERSVAHRGIMVPDTITGLPAPKE